MTERADLEDAVDAAEDLGGIDTMVNNAGIFSETEFLEITDEEYDRLMDINVKGVFYSAQVAGQRLVENGEGGTITCVNGESILVDGGLGHT